MRFGEYLLQNRDHDWVDNYIDYDKLKELVNFVIEKRINSEKNFIKTLDKQWNTYYEFLNMEIDKVKKISIKKEVILQIMKINNFIHLNQEGFRKIVKKHDKISEFKIYPAWQWKIKYNPVFKLYDTIKSISKLYEDRSDIVVENVINNTSFKRKSIKYWVSKRNILPVICHIIPYLPIYIWDEDINEHIYQQITSVYLDNRNLDMYHNRIDKNENSKLVRFRWYGDEMEHIFVERKVHHENWTLQKSSKDRFIMQSRNILPFLRGDLLINNSLAREISTIITQKQLYPKIRTTYNRIAFQLKHSNKIRISLDVNFKLIKEKTNHLEWFTDIENIYDEDIYKFPYSILEIKLCDEMIETPPKWITDLIQSDLVIQQPSFSKFIHGTYTFYGYMCKKIPCWINNDPVDSNSILFDIRWDNENTTNEEINGELIENNNSCCIPYLKKKICNHNNIAEPIKIEPKTFFANERTFLQWFNAAIFIATAGLSLISIGESNTVGILLVILSIKTILYSLYIYYKRNYYLIHRIGTGYNDLYGPGIISLIIILAFIFSIIYEEK